MTERSTRFSERINVSIDEKQNMLLVELRAKLERVYCKRMSYAEVMREAIHALARAHNLI